MSTIGNLKLVVDGARKAYGTYAEYRDRKVSETYDALSHAAGEYAPKAEQAVETARESAKEFYAESRDKLEMSPRLLVLVWKRRSLRLKSRALPR